MKLEVVFQISGTITYPVAAGRITSQIPTFYLDADVQGILTCEHAAKVASRLLNLPGTPSVELSLYVTRFRRSIEVLLEWGQPEFFCFGEKNENG